MSSTFLPRLFRRSLFMAVLVVASVAASNSIAASHTMPITGYAWSSNIGWISFSGTAPTYGVSEDKTNGALSGYAWSSNFGWVSFNASGYTYTTNGAIDQLWDPSQTLTPRCSCDTTLTFNDCTNPSFTTSVDEGPVCYDRVASGNGVTRYTKTSYYSAPSVNFSTGKVTGWVRACAAFADKNACSGALDANSGGWDGWISLSGTAADSSAYGITQSQTTCAWTGYAWGSDAIGWISASGTAIDNSTYGVTGNDPVVCAGGAPATSPVVTLSALPTSVASGGSSVLTWSSTNSPTSCTASGDWSGSKDVTAGSHSETITNIISNKTFTLTCSNGSGSGVASAPVTVSNLPTATLNANPSTINSGQSSMLTWSSTNTTSCTAAGGFSTGGTTSGSVSTGSLTSTQNYQINCTGPGGSVNSNIATVTVSSPLVSISANPARLRSGNTSTISWTSSEVDSCNISGPGLSSSVLIGSSPPIVINFQSTFTITCQKNGSPITRSVTVNVIPGFQEF